MDQNQDRLQELYIRFYQKTATETELAEFISLLQRLDNDEELAATMKQLWQAQQDNDEYFTIAKRNQLADHILNAYPPQQEDVPGAPVHRIHFLKTAWFRYAAAILLLLGAGAYFYFAAHTNKPDLATVTPAVQQDIAPGGNKAVLTLADGSVITLDSAANGRLASQGNVQVVKDANGKLSYVIKPNVAPEAAVTYNTLKTPKGGQYQLTLPDGTQVWLNAASSITYPTAFTGKERRVTMTGEAYLEVAKDKTKPFHIAFSTPSGKDCDVEVLGTHFNINAYQDEPAANTTLLEGSIKFSVEGPQPEARSPKLLSPGQQASISSKANKPSPIQVQQADIEQVMAWKNGAFNFNDKKLEEVMRQLARWYDVEVVYEGKAPDKTFYGQMGRDLNLSQCLKILEKMQVHFRIEAGRKLVVMQ